MVIWVTGCARVLAAAAMVALPAAAFGGALDLPVPADRGLSLAQPVSKPAEQDTPSESQDVAPQNAQLTLAPQYLDAAPPQPNVHGFLSVPFKSAYVTPRGLVVENEGVVIQPIIGLVFPIGDLGALKDFTVVTGIWSSFNSAQSDPLVGWLNEIDYFLTGSWKIGDQLGMALTYSPWFFPQSTATAKPKTEHNIDLKITYSDKWFSDFSINPYVDLWWAVAGSSTVVLGDTGDTGYVELGVVPTKTIKASGDFPITLSFPTYISVGPKGYWDATGAFGGNNFGLFSSSANVSMPMPFIPVQYGHWHFDAGITYDYLLNDALQAAGEILSGNTNHNVLVASVGVGVNF